MRQAEEAEYRQFVGGRMEQWRRTAYLLCRDWHMADDLVSIVLANIYRQWRRVQGANNVDAYVRGMLAKAWLDELRRPWRRERFTAELPDRPDIEVMPGALADRELLLQLLQQLPARRRAVLVLRYYCDLSLEETADVLGVSVGTVKSQAARGLEALRGMVGKPAESRGEWA